MMEIDWHGHGMSWALGEAFASADEAAEWTSGDVARAFEAGAKAALRAAKVSAWQPIETAPMAVLCLVAVVGPGGERRVFVSQTSHEGGSWRWLSTVGWTGWGQMHGSWMPTHWQPLPAPPEAA